MFTFEKTKFILVTGHSQVGMRKNYRKHKFYGSLNIKINNPNLNIFTAKKGDEHGHKSLCRLS